MYGDPGLQNIYLNRGFLSLCCNCRSALQDNSGSEIAKMERVFLLKQNGEASQTRVFSTEVQNSR